MHLVRGILAAHVVLATFVVACESSTSAPAQAEDLDASPPVSEAPAEASTPDAAVDAKTCALPGVYGSKECMACVADECCGFVEACEAEPACKALQRCALDCLLKPDAGGCLDGCLATSPEGRATWDRVDKCWFGPPPGGCLVPCTD